MNAPIANSAPPSFWRTVSVLLKASHRRAMGRLKRQRELFRHRAGNKESIFGSGQGIGWAFTALFMILLHSGFAFFILMLIDGGSRAQTTQNGQVLVSSHFYARDGEISDSRI